MDLQTIVADETGEERLAKPSTIAFIAPNAVTGLALWSGLVSFYFSVEGQYEAALAAIIISAILDGFDGRLARKLKSSSRFGAEFDSLADVISFGVAPAFLLYSWSGERLNGILALSLMLFALGSALRLARFNSSLDQAVPTWRKAYFIGMPTPSAALAVLLPVVAYDLQTANLTLVALHTALIGVLMISTVPTFSGKGCASKVGMRLAVGAVLVSLIVLAVLPPREAFAVAVMAYWASIPVSWLSFRRMARLRIET